MDSVTFSVSGVEQLIKRLHTLEEKVQKKVLNPALRAGAKLVAPEVRKNAPKGPTRKVKGETVRGGALRRSIKVRAMKRKKYRVGINVMIGKGFFKGKTWYGGVIELGAPNRKIKGQHFMRRAYESKREEVVQKVSNMILAGILAQAKS